MWPDGKAFLNDAALIQAAMDSSPKRTFESGSIRPTIETTGAITVMNCGTMTGGEDGINTTDIPQIPA
jgi:hypothetical protein